MPILAVSTKWVHNLLDELSETDNSYDCISKKTPKLEQNNKADSHVLLGQLICFYLLLILFIVCNPIWIPRVFVSIEFSLA